MYVKQAIFTVLVSTSLTVLALPENHDNSHGLKAGRDEVAARNPSYLDPIPRAVEIDERANVEPRKKKTTPKKTTPVKTTPVVEKTTAKTTPVVEKTTAKTTPVVEKTTATPEKPSTSQAPKETSTSVAPKPTTTSSQEVEPTSVKSSSSSIVVAPTLSSTKEVPSSSSLVASDTQIKTSATLTSSALSSSIVPSDTAIVSSNGVTSSALSLSETAPASLSSGAITSLSSTSSEAETITTSPSSSQTEAASITSSSDEPDNTSDPNQETSDPGPGFTIPDLPYGSLFDLGTSIYGDFTSSSTTDLAALPTGNAGVVTGDPATASETVGPSGIVPAYSSSFASDVAAPQVTGTGVAMARRAWANGLPRLVDTTFVTSTTRAVV